MVFVLGLVAIILFYFLILAVGIWAGIKFKGHSEVETMNAGKSIGYFVGTLTLVATWVGGGYINGTAQRMYTDGLVNIQVPVGYSVALIVGALLFIKKMRDGNYITLLDPFQFKYGYKYGATLLFPALTSEFFWVAAVLNSLGYTVEIVVGIDSKLAVIVSALFVGVYTLVGGLYSVTYTDVIQLVFIVTGVLLVTPFAMTNPQIDHSLVKKPSDWLGEIRSDEIAVYIENLVLLILGGIPWQGYFQRVFSIKTTHMALKMSWASSILTLLMAIPVIVIGYAALITDWSKTKLGKAPDRKKASELLPLVMRYLVPPAVSFFGLGAVTSAVMSSADSAILASSALFSRNIYKHLFRPKASDKEIHWILRASILIFTSLATVFAITWRNVYYLSSMCSDLVYVILFPQLLLTLYFPRYVNTYGSSVAYLFALVTRILGGEPGLGIPAVLKFPWYNYQKKLQRFPFKTFIVILSAGLFVLVSYITDKLFIDRKLNPKYDIFRVYKKPPESDDTAADDKAKVNNDSKPNPDEKAKSGPKENPDLKAKPGPKENPDNKGTTGGTKATSDVKETDVNSKEKKKKWFW